MIRIGELAKKANISKRTLYYYEQIELLQPALIK
ncbi:MerR family transcriptional regulator [Bacillus horti]|uniref:DNA-binding transcriptional MerR regulator n=1 Tax=Caldalkalibacillus horti TaxID=77523 RepID=A0ABT9W2M5_9BACI|nr:MerR family DNA-binding transcriptional regulator [Bacillus horti]MDQ0167497.1 DNA-binding transcriptional MerR regulator [Bacillus horti]